MSDEYVYEDADEYEDAGVLEQQRRAAPGAVRSPKASKLRKARRAKVRPKKKVPRKKKSQFVVLADQHVEDFAQYFRDQQDLTFAFIGYEHDGYHGANDVGPDLVSALEMARCAYAGEIYEPLRALDRFSHRPGRNRAATLRGVTLRIDEMLRRVGTSFILAWHLRGDLSAHLCFSPDRSWEDARQEFIWLIQEELYCYFD